MKAFRIREFGAPSLATLDDVPTPVPGPGQVRVRIEAASVNPLDLKILAGYMQSVFPVSLPYTLGTDFAGVVEATTLDAGQLQPGDRVVGRLDPSSGGAFAQQVIASVESLGRIPASMSFEQAAALPSAAGTAWLALFGAGKLSAGQKVLIHAAAGGVGTYAVQFAKQAGAHVIATCSSKNHALVKELGADEVIDYRNEDFAARLNNVDLVIDTIGGDTAERSWSVIRGGGALVTLVDFAIKSRGDIRGEFVFFQHDRAALENIISGFDNNWLQVILDTIHPLDDARAALEHVAGGHARGKVVIRVAR
jgi:NADPH:quinone reductase-like Zn-dependent oxidoreductase